MSRGKFCFVDEVRDLSTAADRERRRRREALIAKLISRAIDLGLSGRVADARRVMRVVERLQSGEIVMAASK